MSQFDKSRLKTLDFEELRQIVGSDKYSQEAHDAAIKEIQSRGEAITAERIQWLQEQEWERCATEAEEAGTKSLFILAKIWFFLVPLVGILYWIFRFRKWKRKRNEAILFACLGLVTQVTIIYIFAE